MAFIARESIIRPNCLKVERAMIFFISISKLAAIEAIKVVIVAVIKRRVVIIDDLKINLLKRIRR